MLEKDSQILQETWESGYKTEAHMDRQERDSKWMLEAQNKNIKLQNTPALNQVQGP